MPYKIIPFTKSDSDEEGRIKGYGSTFGGKPDSYGDVIDPRAFEETIAKNGRGGMGFAMLWQHGHKDPAGVWDFVGTNTKGLKVDGLMEIGTDIGRHRYNLVKMKAVKGLSIGFDLMRNSKGKVVEDAYERNDKTGITLLKRLELWEVSPVTFAANTRATITGVKSLEGAKTVREIENILRDSGLSKSDALYLASMCKSGLRDSGADSEISVLLETVKKASYDIALTGLLQSLNTVNEMIKS